MVLMEFKAVENPILTFDKKKNIWIPQPTRFWILEKNLHKKISRLEEKGFIKYWEKKITDDEKLFQFFINLHKKEIQKRKSVLEKDFKHLRDTKSYNVLLDENLGIGSIRNFEKKPFKVKCLHLWTAYHLGDKDFQNPIGEFVLKRV